MNERDDLKALIESVIVNELDFEADVLMDALPIGVLGTDPLGYCTYSNDVFAQFLGVTTDQLIGLDWSRSCLDTRGRDALLRAIQQAAREGSYPPLRLALKRDDGTDQLVFMRGSADNSGQVLHLVSVENVWGSRQSS